MKSLSDCVVLCFRTDLLASIPVNLSAMIQHSIAHTIRIDGLDAFRLRKSSIGSEMSSPSQLPLEGPIRLNPAPDSIS